MKRLAFTIIVAAILISFFGCSPSNKPGMPVVLVTDFGKKIVPDAAPD
jgi:hypothetical protein